MKRFIALTAMSALFATAVFAADLSNTNSDDKSQYNFFNPTPHDLMRPINSDEFDNVLDAHTLDAGHVQVEASLINYYYYSTHYYLSSLSYRLAEDEYTWTPRFRVGLLNNVDFEVNPTYSIRSENFNGAYFAPYTPYAFDYTTHTSGFGSIGLGPKINLWGNDDSPTALAIHPYLSIPTRNGDVLGGMDIAFGLQMPRGLYLKLDTEFYVTDDSQRTIYGGFQNSVSLHQTLCSKVEVYWYLNSIVTTDPTQTWYGYTGFGAIYKLTADLELYGGIGFGLDSEAFDYNPRFGAVLRF
jgi:opacity protein-like surface antigen